ncbi:ash family protein [Salmonella enterica]|nr:ash family protein [Salmonella enterica]
MSIKATLDHLHYWRYAYPALYKTSAGICTPKNSMATQTPKASFFVSCLHVSISGGKTRYVSMVTLAGLPKGRPVSIEAGSANPVNVTAPIDICTSSGDSSNSMEAAVMATTPTQSHPVSARHNHVNKPFFVFRFWSPHLLMRDIIATSEKQARSRLRRPSWTLDKRYPIPVTDAVYQVVSLMRYTDGRRRTCQHREMWTSREQAEEYAARVAFMTDYVTVTADVVEVFHV